MKKFITLALALVAVPLLVLGQAPAHSPRQMVEKVVVEPGQGPMGPECSMMGAGHGRMGGDGCCQMGGRGRGPKMMGEGGPGIGMLMQMADKLELTADQKAKLEKMQTDFQMAAIDQEAKIKKTGIQLRSLMRDDKAATATVEARIDEMAKFRAEMAKMRYRHHAEVRGILTEKQVDMLKKMRDERPMMKRIREIRMMDTDTDQPDPHDGLEG
jgi:Spy/CpxP family protein refolding chaperone